MKSRYWGLQTEKAQQNFPFSLPPVALDLIYSMAEVKKAAAIANKEIGLFHSDITDAISATCDEIIQRTHDHEFVTCSLQGGAGTSINMNVNEVIATRATEILKSKNTSIVVHPLDHVNLHQSTNDVNPSALRILCIRLGNVLISALDALVYSFEKQAKKYAQVKKLGRTHMQDAVPTTFGEEFQAYATIMKRHSKHVSATLKPLYELNLGGTAIGNKVNSSDEFIESVYKNLQKITHLTVKPASNMMALTSSATDFCILSSALHILTVDLSKIATDIRFLSSGPRGGIGEIHLPELQAGSSIMPGKVNPVIPEVINQMYYVISGKHLSITQATANSHLELAIMFPVIADALICELKIVKEALILFKEKCVDILEIDEKRSNDLLEKSSAYATVFTKKLGYDTVAALVKESIQTGKTFHKLVTEKELLTEDEFQQVLNGFI